MAKNRPRNDDCEKHRNRLTFQNELLLSVGAEDPLLRVEVGTAGRHADLPRVQRSSPGEVDSKSDELEAKWNCGMWL